MKKIFAIALVLAMMLSMAVVATAADDTLDLSTDEKTKSTSAITITTGASNDTTEVYSVDVTWTDTAIGLTTSYGWNPVSHEYDIPKATTVDDGTAQVTVTNHSNAELYATVTTDYTGDKFTIDCGSKATLADASLVALGTPNAIDKDNTKVLGITVTLNDGKIITDATLTFNATVTITKN